MITIVGVGALGSHVALFLRNVDQPIKVIDFDRVAQKNTAAQMYGTASVGRNKAQALSQTMQFLFSTKLTTAPHRLTDANVAQLLGGATLVIDCLDNGPSRHLVQDYVRANDIACLHGALAADGQLGRIVWDHDFTIDDAPAGVATCETGEHLPHVGMVAACIARVAQSYLATGTQRNIQILGTGVAIAL